MAKGRKATAGPKTGHRKAAGETEPLSARLVPVDPALAAHQPPEDLPEAASQAWRTCIAEMVGNRHVREADLILLRRYVQWVQIGEDAWADYLRFGPKVRADGKVIRNPAIQTLKEAATQERYYSDLLGLNPLARIRQNLAEIDAANGVLTLRDRLVSNLTGR